jgi:hypothetical protein
MRIGLGFSCALPARGLNKLEESTSDELLA